MRLLFPASPGAAGEDLTEDELHELYRHPAPRSGRVWLRSNFVTSLDGSIQGADGRSGSINTASDQHVFALHRAHADAILVGAQTARAEGYRAVDLAPWQQDLRVKEGLAPFPLLVVLSGSLEVDPTIASNGDLDVGPVVVLTTAGKRASELGPFTATGVEVVQVPESDSRVDLPAAMAWLAASGHRRVLCEGGSRLHRDLLAADLVDEMSLTLAPVVVGGEGRRTTAGGPLPASPAFRLGSALYADDDTLFLNYLHH